VVYQKTAGTKQLANNFSHYRNPVVASLIQCYVFRMFTIISKSILKYHAALVIALMLLTLALSEMSIAVAANGDWIKFHSANLPPSPLKTRQAKKKGIELKAMPGTLIGGHLFLPESTGVHPAIILTHDCRGVRAFHLE
jgi:hypothetical protein